MIGREKNIAPDTGQIRLAHGAELSPADRLSFRLVAGGAARIAHASLSLQPARWRGRERRSPVNLSRRGEDDVWTRLAGGIWAESRSAAAIQFWEETPGREQIVASHDGYRGMPGRPIHRRRIRRSGGKWRVADEITGRGRQRVELRFHLPRAVIAADSEGARVAYLDGWRLRLRVEGWHAPEASVELGRHSSAGHTEESCPVLVYRWHTRLPFEVETVWEVGRAAAVPSDRASVGGKEEIGLSSRAGRGESADSLARCPLRHPSSVIRHL
jgi:hypothetical protein